MLPFRKIVFPVDYSDACRATAPHVKSVLRHFSAELTLVHAYGEEGLSFIDFPVDDSDRTERAREFETTRLREFAQELFPEAHAQCFAEVGEAGTVIQNVITHQGCDLVMMSTHGRGPVRRLMVGSVTTKVLHDSNCAVWTATPAAMQAHSPEYRSIVCAVDDTDEGRSVIVAGTALAKAYDAKLGVVHVLGLPPMSMEVDYAAIRSDLLQGAEERLRQTLASLQVTAEYAVVEGSVAHSLHDWLSERQADLMVAGRGHAGEGMGRVWSNLYSIVRESPCPVLSL